MSSLRAWLAVIEMTDPAPSRYDADYPIPDPGTPPSSNRELVEQLASESLMVITVLEGWTWERQKLGGKWIWLLTLLPRIFRSRPRSFAVCEKVVAQEKDPDTALLLAWRYRGRKKETMRAFAALERTTMRTEFPHEFIGTINANDYADERVTFGNQPAGIVVPSSTAHSVIFIWRVSYGPDEGWYDIYADYKGRGFEVVDGRTGENLTGPLYLDWRDDKVVHAAAEAVHGPRRRRAREANTASGPTGAPF